MASEDVIELGSSDEDEEPVPKKKKPMPNAMVHIPNKLTSLSGKSGFSAKSVKPKTPSKGINPISIAKGTIGKSITVTKVPGSNIVSNPFAGIKVNGTSVTNVKKTKQSPKKCLIPIGPKPIVSVPMRQVVGPIKVSNPHTVLPIRQSLLRQNTTSGITKLPPGITIKRTPMVSESKRKYIQMVSNTGPIKVIPIKKCKKPVVNTGEVVNLDDDDSPAPAGGPQWYLRPEEQNKSDPDKSKDKVSPDENKEGETKIVEASEKASDNMETENNKEPESINFIEITIEDSPIKPPNKRKDEVGTELAITIDDSPVKASTGKRTRKSDDEEEKPRKKKPHSKKKLNYPANTVEIEIDPLPVPDNVEKAKEQETNNDDQIVEIEESPLKTFENLESSTPQKPKSSPIKIKAKPQMSLLTSETTSKGEFHPVYQQFIDLCFKLENSEDMVKIVEKKIKGYYRQVPKEYTESEAFVDMVSGKIVSMKAGPEKMYLYIKDVVDELNLQRKMAKIQPVKDAAVEEQEKFLYGEDSEFNLKRQRQIRKLEKTLKKLHRAIQKLEEQEVDFDDEEDSVYLLTERYKERMVRVHTKFCQLTNTKMPSEPRVIIDPRPGQPKGPAKKLEKWINRKVPIGSPRPFPDFHDVLRCVREANDEDKLLWNDADIMDEARDLFTRCGKKLQRRRQENEWRLAASRIAAEVDPAEESEDLKKKLENNKRLASVKETEVLNKYADRQNLLKLEAVEIGDKEADESPVESDEDEVTEETSLHNKENRKERIKRLLHDKSKKVSQEMVVKDNVDSNKPSNNKTAIEKIDLNEKETNTIKSDGNNTDREEKTQEQANDPLETDNPENNDLDTIHTLSDDSQKLDSDIDELNLLQKLHSGNEVDTSTLESSDSDSPIAISDTLSSGDNKVPESDVISIENSSYSESEDKAENNSNEKIDSTDSKSKEKEFDACSSNKEKEATVDNQENEMASNIPLEEKTCDLNMEIECSNKGVEIKVHKNNNDEYNESIEDILLASSDDETESKDTKNKENDSKPKNNTEEKENIETVTQENNSNAEVFSLDGETNSSKTDSPENEICLNLRDDVISIDETLVEEQQKPVETDKLEVSKTNICVEKADSGSIERISMLTNKAKDKVDSTIDICNTKPSEPIEQDKEIDETNRNIDSGDSKIGEESNSKVIRERKIDSHDSKVVKESKTDSHDSKVVKESKIDSDDSKGVEGSKIDSDVSKGVEGSKIDSDDSKVVEESKIESDDLKVVKESKINSDDSKGVEGSKIDSDDSKGVERSKIDSDDSKGVEGSKIDSDDSKGVEGSKIDSDDSMVVEESKIESDDSKVVKESKIDSDDSKGVEGSKIDSDDSKGVEGSKIDSDDSKVVEGSKIDSDDLKVEGSLMKKI